MVVPVVFWQEDWYYSFLGTFVVRYINSLHSTWFVNSAAHMFGDRPYKAGIEPVENPWVSVITFGEGESVLYLRNKNVMDVLLSNLKANAHSDFIL